MMNRLFLKYNIPVQIKYLQPLLTIRTWFAFTSFKENEMAEDNKSLGLLEPKDSTALETHQRLKGF